MSSQKQIHENWNKFLKEYTPSNEPEPEEDEKVAAAPEPEPEQPQEEEPSKVIAGINSLSYPDSLLNMLKNVELTGPQKRQLLNLMLQATEQDDIVLEAIGDAQRDPRTFSPKTSKRLNDLIGSFNLKPKAKNNLEKVLNKWAKMNTVKFSKAAMDDEDTADEPTEPGRPVSPEAPMDDEDISDEPTEPGRAVSPARQPAMAAPEEPARSQAPAADSRYAGKGWDPTPRGPEQRGEWIEDPTDDIAVKAILQDLAQFRQEDRKYKDARKQLEYLEALVERGGGLFIEDRETGDKNVTPKWVPHENPEFAGGYQIQPQKFSFALYVPASMGNFFRQSAALATKILDPLGDFAGMKLSKNISPRNQQYLKMFVKEFKKGFQSRRKPEDPKNLEESFDRLQTLAGINKRIL